MYLGQFKNVYMPDYHPNEPTVNRLASDLYTRFQFVGQFPIGMAAWPAVYQYSAYQQEDKNPPIGGFMRAPSMEEINDLAARRRQDVGPGLGVHRDRRCA